MRLRNEVSIAELSLSDSEGVEPPAKNGDKRADCLRDFLPGAIRV